MHRVLGLPRITDANGIGYADDYDPAVHAYHWMVWALPGLPLQLYLESTDADLMRMAEHRQRMIELVARSGGSNAKYAAMALDLLR